jgi:hypothetical protein
MMRSRRPRLLGYSRGRLFHIFIHPHFLTTSAFEKFYAGP